jgi:hypothetical protein
MSYPWEINSQLLPWQPNVLWPRLITITRPTASVGSGILPYQGVTEAAETILVPAPGVLANITMASTGRNKSTGGLPSDAPGPDHWTITIPASAIASIPLIVERDVVYDDLGRRYQVTGYEPTSLGGTIDTIRLVT